MKQILVACAIVVALLGFSATEFNRQSASKSLPSGLSDEPVIVVKPSSGPETEWFAAPGVVGRLLYSDAKKSEFSYRWHIFGGDPDKPDDLLAISFTAFLSNPILSPDGSMVTLEGDRPHQGRDVDNCHDLIIADLKTGQPIGSVDYLYSDGSHVKWSPDGRRIAYVRGSPHTIFGTPVDMPYRLATLDIAKQKEDTWAANDSHIRALAWPSSGYLYFETQDLPDKARAINRISPTGKVTLVSRANSQALPSPDGTRIAFVETKGDRSNSTGNWSLAITKADGSGRRLLSKGTGTVPVFLWTADNKHLLSWSAESEDSTKTGKIQVREWDIPNAKSRVVADLQLPPILIEKSDNPFEGHRCVPLSVSKDGNFLFFRHNQLVRDPNRQPDGTLIFMLRTGTLHALRLSDGKLMTIAILRDADFAWHDESKPAPPDTLKRPQG